MRWCGSFKWQAIRDETWMLERMRRGWKRRRHVFFRKGVVSMILRALTLNGDVLESTFYDQATGVGAAAGTRGAARGVVGLLDGLGACHSLVLRAIGWGGCVATCHHLDDRAGLWPLGVLRQSRLSPPADEPRAHPGLRAHLCGGRGGRDFLQLRAGSGGHPARKLAASRADCATHVFDGCHLRGAVDYPVGVGAAGGGRYGYGTLQRWRHGWQWSARRSGWRFWWSGRSQAGATESSQLCGCVQGAWGVRGEHSLSSVHTRLQRQRI